MKMQLTRRRIEGTMRADFPFLFLTNALAIGSFVPLGAADTRQELEPFLNEYCYSCHDDADPKADLDLWNLPFEVGNEANFEAWQRVFRKVREGEMPPKKRDRPEDGKLAGFLKALGEPLYAHDRAQIETGGRVSGRRLTRTEYENSLHALLGTDIPLADLLVPDPEGGFASTATSQQLSHFHLAGYLNAAGVALDDAFGRALGKDDAFRQKLGVEVVTRGFHQKNWRGPEPFGDHMVSWALNPLFAGRMPTATVPADGWYEITVHDAEGINRGSDGSVWATLNSGAGESSEPLEYRIGIVEGADQPRDAVFRAWIREGHMLLLKPAEAASKTVGGRGRGFFEKNDFEKQGYDGLRFTGVTLARVYENDREEVFQRLFPGLARDEVETGPADEDAQLNRLVADFASLAFRRPVGTQESSPYAEIARRSRKAGEGFAQALRAAYHGILCSPRFLTFIEAPGALDGYEIATRLSYMLWNSPPDGTLRRLADGGQLQNPVTLAAQVDRLLDDPRSQRFIRTFTDEWIELRKIEATQPDRRFMFFGPVLQESMLAETRAFFGELVAGDLSVTNFLNSDFTYLNTHLWDYYGLDGVEVVPGKGMQKVALPPGVRSGLLTQAAVLKVTADGTVTSPVVRGVFVNERILGRHIDPPPPNIPALEPDTRGAVSIRDQLEKHRGSTNCASCHAKIDPAGFALESFDPVGRIREYYGRPGKSLKVDTSGVTPDGHEFVDYNEWKSILLAEPEKLAKAFAGHLLSYGTGGGIRFSDEEALKEIVASTRHQEYGVRSLIRATVTSPLFLER